MQERYVFKPQKYSKSYGTCDEMESSSTPTSFKIFVTPIIQAVLLP